MQHYFQNIYMIALSTLCELIYIRSLGSSLFFDQAMEVRFGRL